MASAYPKTDKKEKKFNPFTLQYLSFAKVVWEMGQYDQIPKQFRMEPEPYNDYEPYMIMLNKHFVKNGYEIRPSFYKEYFHKLEVARIKRRNSYTRYKRNKYSWEDFHKAPEDISICQICWIKKFYPNIEKHPPKPWPNTYCPYHDIVKHHFKEYDPGFDY